MKLRGAINKVFVRRDERLLVKGQHFPYPLKYDTSRITLAAMKLNIKFVDKLQVG